jgi:hypothetical protein
LFSQSSWLWSFVSPSPLDSGVCVVCVYFFFSFFLFSGKRSFPRGPAGVIVSVLSRRWSVLCINRLQISTLDLRLSIGFLETCAAQMGSPALSCSAATVSGYRDQWWPARDCHAPVKFSLLPARGVSLRRLLAGQRLRMGLWVADLSAGGFRGRRVLYTRRSPAKTVPTLRRFWIVFSTSSVYIPMCLLLITVCLYVMHKCSWAYLVSARLGQSSYVDCLSFICKEVIYFGSL